MRGSCREAAEGASWKSAELAPSGPLGHLPRDRGRICPLSGAPKANCVGSPQTKTPRSFDRGVFIRGNRLLRVQEAEAVGLEAPWLLQ